MSDADGYRKYVFDTARRRFVGEFEAMYRAESTEGFDSWHQDDSRQLQRQVALEILARWNFDRVLDVGCGKGAFTHRLKKANNDVLAVDISQTAIEIARSRFPDVRFQQADLSPASRDWDALGGHFDLVVSLETLSYMAEWREVLARFATVARFGLIALYLPSEPIGFVKSHDELAAAFAEHFVVHEDVRLLISGHGVLFGESRHATRAE